MINTERNSRRSLWIYGKESQAGFALKKCKTVTGNWWSAISSFEAGGLFFYLLSGCECARNRFFDGI
jgi:hypothetical protein